MRMFRLVAALLVVFLLGQASLPVPAVARTPQERGTDGTQSGATRADGQAADGSPRTPDTEPRAATAVLAALKMQAGPHLRDDLEVLIGARRSELVGPRAHLVRFALGPGIRVEHALAVLRADPRVRFAEPDYIITTDVVSNDPYYSDGSLWGMYGPSTTPANAFGSRASDAWAAGHFGSHTAVVGIVDEGIQVDHPDLAANIWTNPFETPGNGIDDDGNGYVDDVHGWDFHNNDNTVYDGAGTDAHGTHVAGTVGAVGGNGIGVTGVSWAVTMISAKALHGGSGLTSNAVRALDYLTDLKLRHGIKIVATNNSWGSGAHSQALLEAIERAGDAGILFVAAAGNDGANTDSTPFYPAAYQCDASGTRSWDCIVSVAAIGPDGSRPSFSNYGPTSVDLGAPGVDVASTVPSNAYATYSGTSMAAPHVTGALALLEACNPSLSAPQLRTVLLGSVTSTSSLSTATLTGGRLNVAGMTPSCDPSAGPVALLHAPPGYYITTSTVKQRSQLAVAWRGDDAPVGARQAQAGEGIGGHKVVVEGPGGEGLERADEAAHRTGRELSAGVLEGVDAGDGQLVERGDRGRSREAGEHHLVVAEGGGSQTAPAAGGKVGRDGVREVHNCFLRPAA